MNNFRFIYVLLPLAFLMSKCSYPDKNKQILKDYVESIEKEVKKTISKCHCQDLLLQPYNVIKKLYSETKKQLKNKGAYNESLDYMYIDIGFDDFPADFTTLSLQELDEVLKKISEDKRVLSYSIKYIDPVRRKYHISSSVLRSNIKEDNYEAKNMSGGRASFSDYSLSCYNFNKGSSKKPPYLYEFEFEKEQKHKKDFILKIKIKLLCNYRDALRSLKLRLDE